VPVLLQLAKRLIMRKVLLVLYALTILTLPVSAQDISSEAPPPPIPADVRARLARLLPDFAGADVKPSGERKFYSSDLFRYIDGAAEAFLGYDMVAMVHQEYRVKAADITLDIYDMGKALNAFGMYSAERSPSYHFLSVGAEGYVSDFVLNFFQGEFYVKLSAFSDDGKSAPDLVPFAQAISTRIGSEKSSPTALSILPSEHRAAKSEKFINKEPLGHEYLAPAIEATYLVDGKSVVLLISKASDAAGATEKVRQLRDDFRKSGKVEPLPGAVPGVFRGSNPYEGEMVFFSQGIYAIVCVDPPPQPMQFLKGVMDHLTKPQANLSF
jgi:hypothetical protein